MARNFSPVAVVAGALLLAPVAVAAGAPPVVTLTGHKTASLKLVSSNGDTTVTLGLMVGKDTPVEVITKDASVVKAFAAATDKRLKEAEARTKDILKQVEDASKKGDTAKVKELVEALAKDSDDLLLVPAVAEGALAYKDKRWQLVGTMRPFEPAGKDKGVKLGTGTVRGEAVTGEYKAGEVKSSLAVRAGDLTVILTGPAAKESAKGDVRATGALRLGKSGEAVLEATKVEPVKK